MREEFYIVAGAKFEDQLDWNKIMLLDMKLKGKVPLLDSKITRNFTAMSICDFGIKNNRIEGCLVNILVKDDHLLMKLANILPWEKMFEIILPDLKKTAKGQYHRGRKLKIRIHLGVFLLQQFYNKTDRQIEYALKENAVFQLFCGKGIIHNWHCPDHTKVEEFRSRISPENQRELANLITKNATNLGFADPKHCDIDSTIQTANITRPSKAKTLTKIACIAKKVSSFLEKKILTPMEFISSGLSCFNLNV